MQIILSCWGELPEERQTFPYMKGVFERLITAEELQRAQQAVELERRQYDKIRKTLAREEDEQAYEPMSSPEIIESGGAPTLSAGTAVSSKPTTTRVFLGSNVTDASSRPADLRGYEPFILAKGSTSSEDRIIGNDSANLFAATWV